MCVKLRLITPKHLTYAGFVGGANTQMGKIPDDGLVCQGTRR
jgi:hypothetical protein